MIICRAIKDILRHQEVFVDYGPEYAAELGIDQSTYDTYTRPEDHKTVAIPCSFCGITFSSQQFLDIHHPKCGKKKNPSTHVEGNKQSQRKQGPVEGGFPCLVSTCGKVYTHKDNMLRHHRIVHCGEKKFLCIDCGKAFLTQQQLQRHQHAVHLKEKPFKCSTCGLAFARKSYLTAHMDSVHLGKRPFLCKDCGLTFTVISNLYRHQKLHTTEPPKFTCTYTGCLATYTTNASLKNHLMDHSGLRPFPCPYESCDERFRAQHMVNHHIKTAKKHAGHRLASKFIDKHLLPFTCQVDIVGHFCLYSFALLKILVSSFGWIDIMSCKFKKVLFRRKDVSIGMRQRWRETGTWRSFTPRIVIEEQNLRHFGCKLSP